MANGYMIIRGGYDHNNTSFTIKNTGDNPITITYPDRMTYTVSPAVSGIRYTSDGQICQKRKPVYKYQLLNWIGER